MGTLMVKIEVFQNEAFIKFSAKLKKLSSGNQSERKKQNKTKPEQNTSLL